MGFMLFWQDSDQAGEHFHLTRIFAETEEVALSTARERVRNPPPGEPAIDGPWYLFSYASRLEGQDPIFDKEGLI